MITTELHADMARRRAVMLYTVMSLKNKRRYNYRLALKVATLARTHIKQQADDSDPWPKRKAKPGRKMLTRMARRNRLRITSTSLEGTVTYKSQDTGERAAIHHHGFTEIIRARTATENTTAQAPASEAQIKTLTSLGVDVAKFDNLTWAQAGAIIRSKRHRGRKSRKSSGKS